jgi:beta-N-acetylhexosaminidase
MAFGGVVVSDDLEMKAIASRWGAGEAAVLAALAGCDVLCVCKSADAQVDAVEALVRAFESEAFGKPDLDDPGLRVRRMKERFLLPFSVPDRKAARQAAGVGESVALARRIAEESGLSA